MKEACSRLQKKYPECPAGCTATGEPRAGRALGVVPRPLDSSELEHTSMSVCVCVCGGGVLPPTLPLSGTVTVDSRTAAK